MRTTKTFLFFFSVILIAFNLNTAFAQEFHGAVSAPVYNGGITALKDFIFHKVNNPKEFDESKVKGVVTVSYLINEKGAVENVKVLRGIDAKYDSEAVRVTKLITGWQAAVQWGKPVCVRVIMPVEFYLDKENKEGEAFKVNGIVTDRVTNKPLEGVLVLVKGTSTGAISDVNGNYSIDVPGEEYELEFSAMGYGMKVEKVNKNRSINAELLPEDIVIDFAVN